MATHGPLWEQAILAIRGSKSARHLGISGGSVNYRLMDDGTAYILDPSPENLHVILGHFRNMRQTGHMSLSGPKGVASEQGTVLAHRKYNFAMVCGILIRAGKNAQKYPGTSLGVEHANLALFCRQTIYDECGFCLTFQFKPERGPAFTIAPAPRIKNDEDKKVKAGGVSKLQAPIDRNRDRFLALATGGKIRAGKQFWSDDPGNLDVILMQEMIQAGIWTENHMKTAKASRLPALYLPIHHQPTGDHIEGVTGFEAWIIDTPEARRACGKDACHFVHAGSDGVYWRYDWEEAGENGENNHYMKGKNK